MGEGISAAMERGSVIASAICHHFGNTERIYSEYESGILPLRNYMQRQWSFVGNMANTFAEMKM